MLLGVEIGGTKTQVGVAADAFGDCEELLRFDVDRRAGAAGIQQQILQACGDLSRRRPITAVGVGFGGPVDAAAGATRISHQVDGWRDFPLARWLSEALSVPVQIGNDCDTAALAEAVLGAGQGQGCVFYVTAGTGVGGGLVRDGRLVGQQQPAIAEIGHLRPGLGCTAPEATVECFASGPGLVATAAILAAHAGKGAGKDAAVDSAEIMSAETMRPRQETSSNSPADWSSWSELARQAGPGASAELLQAGQGDLQRVSAAAVAQLAAAGNPLAAAAVAHAVRTLGWAIAQAITLTAPDVVVVGGGVSLMSPLLFWRPLQAAIAEYVFPPLANSFTIKRPALGEQVVVRGALLLASQVADDRSRERNDR